MTETIRSIADDVWKRHLEKDPLLRAREGLEVTEIPAPTFEQASEDAAFAGAILSRTDAIDPSSMSHDDALTASFIRHSLSVVVEAPAYHWWGFSVTPYSIGLAVTHLAQYVFGPFRFTDAGSVERYRSLVHDFATVVDLAGDKLVRQAEMGIRIPKPAIDGSRATLAGLSAAAPTQFVPAPERLVSLGDAAGATRDAIERLVTEEVVAAYGRAQAVLDDTYVAAAPDDVGWAQFDGGVDFYRYATRMRNTLDLDPERVFATGKEEVAKLTEGMAELRAEMGFTGTESEFHEQLRHEPSLYASTPDEVEARYLGFMARLERVLPRYFSVLPEAPYGVERLDPQLEATMTYGYYEPPTPDNAAGRYRFNASQLDQRSLLNAAAIIYHELAPGHHFHIARQRENKQLPDIRREAFGIGAFNEGWAEYAAQVAGEAGCYEDPLERYGHLSHQRFIAQRLVVDPGMNLFGWSLEEGRRYMREKTFESETQIATETLRYSTDLPAQALGYRLGHLSIAAARDRAKAKLGAAFDIRDFHEAILSQGALPLPVLDEHIDHFASGA